ncbi:serine hydrolase [Maribacter sp. X9]|uniref:serine hydrolase n=1 Tax=Maribacter sp. X9 TaxID=3402159 RepID=UPI003AF3FF55
MENRSLAERLKYHRQSKGYSQEELSMRTNVTVRTIQRIEKADVNPHLNTIKLLAAALDVEVNELMPLQNPKEETLKKKWLLLIHATPLLGIFLPLFNVLIPLFLWIHKREDNPIYDVHGRKVINFQITVCILAVLSFISLLTIEKWGFFIFMSTVPICIGIMLFNIIYVLQKDKCYYPLAIPFLRTKFSKGLKCVLFLAALLTFCNCTSQVDQNIERIDGSSISRTELDARIAHLVDTANVTGFTVTIFNKDTVAYQKAFGYANSAKKDSLKIQDVMYGASLSKAVFAYIVSAMVNEGLLDLDTPLQDYLDVPLPEIPFRMEWRDFKDLANDERYNNITARMCLSHTTGLPNWRWINRMGEFQPDGKIQIYTDPGSTYSYSGEGIRLLQKVMERILGSGLEEWARERVFDPLGMDMTSYVWQERFENNYCFGHTKDQQVLAKDTEDQAGAAGSMETTSVDYAKFLTKIMELSTNNSEVTRLMFKPNIQIHSKKQFGLEALKQTVENDAIALSYGLGWGILTLPYGHGYFKEGHGEGFQHYSILFPEKQIGILIMSNSDNAESIFKEVLEIGIGDYYTPWYWEDYIPYNQ